MNDFDIQGDDAIDNMDFAGVADLPENVLAFDGKLAVNLSLSYKHTPIEKEGDKEKKTLTVSCEVISVVESTNEEFALPKKDSRMQFYFGLMKKDETQAHSRGASAFKPHAIALAKALNISPTMETLLEKVKDVKAIVTVRTKKDEKYGNEAGYRVELEKIEFPA